MALEKRAAILRAKGESAMANPLRNEGQFHTQATDDFHLVVGERSHVRAKVSAMKFRIYTAKVAATGFCPSCQYERAIYRRRLNHPMQLLLTVVTLGLWAVPWAALWLASLRQPWRCGMCRRKVVQTEAAMTSRELATAAPWE